ncbi:MAG: fused MFS/spermidine synthase [Flavobacteriales bacterium]
MSKKNLYTLSFIEGGIVMLTELTGAKISEAFHGTALYVWGVILGITLLSLAIGYFLGGILQNKNEKKRLLYLLSIAAAYLLILPEWAEYLMKNFIETGVYTSVLTTTLLFLSPPLICFGTAPPLIISILRENKNTSGRISGNVFTISTIGGIFTTFLTGFYLIPNYGMEYSLYFSSCILSIFLFFLYFSQKIYFIPFLLIFLLIISSPLAEDKGYVDKRSLIRIREKSEGLFGQIIIEGFYLLMVLYRPSGIKGQIPRI